jgi:hypothetical protein
VKRRFLPLLPLPLLLALGAWASARAADRAAEAGAKLIALLAPLAHDRSVQEPDAEFEPGIPADVVVVASPLAAPTGKAPTGKAPPGKAPKRALAPPSAPHVLFVAQDRVLRLASSGARPRGAVVPGTTVRPAGLKLSGVAALGIGLLDGDVLTRAVGQPALSSGAVIQAVLAARARRAPVLEGEFWRGNERWLLRVEQPYLPPA